MKQDISNTNRHMLFDYFNENNKFSSNELHAAVLDHSIDIKTNSIQTAIHDCLDKGVFKHICNGIYSLSRTDINGETLTCLLINGDNRDLSVIEDNSVDVIITDRPEYMNRYNIDLFSKTNKTSYIFDAKDYKEKERILKPGRFILEYMPQSNLENYEKVCKIKNAARKGGFNYYSNLNWTKMLAGVDISLGKEKVILFSKGAARDFYMSNDRKFNEKTSTITLPTVFNLGKAYSLYDNVEIVARTLQFISADNPDFEIEKYLNIKSVSDNSFRVIDNLVIEKNPSIYQELTQTIDALKEINIATKRLKIAIDVAIDALEAFYEGPEAFHIFEKHQLYFGMTLDDAANELNKLPEFKNENLNIAIAKAKKVLYKDEEFPDLYRRSEKYWSDVKNSPHTLECSARGDIRFSSSHIKLKINGIEKTIENWFNDSKKNSNDNPVNRGDPYDYVLDPFTGNKLYETDEIQDMYKGLWVSYLSRNPELVEYASKFASFKDSKYSPTLPIKSSDIVSTYVKDKDAFINSIKTGKWYKNLQYKNGKGVEYHTDNRNFQNGSDKKEKFSLIR